MRHEVLWQATSINFKRESRMTAQPRSPLCASLSAIPETLLVPAQHLHGGSVGARIAHGIESSLMVAVRQPQYHSRPHRHDAEQLNYVLAGELYVFVDGTGFLAKAGDIFRIPRNAVHWSWVQGATPCTLLETHAPPLIGDPGVTATAVSLIEDGEAQDSMTPVSTVWPEGIDQAAVEARTVGEAGIP